MGKRSRRTNNPRGRRALPAPAAAATPAEPERLLLDAIAAGELDDHLTALADAVYARQQTAGDDQLRQRAGDALRR